MVAVEFTAGTTSLAITERVIRVECSALAWLSEQTKECLMWPRIAEDYIMHYSQLFTFDTNVCSL